MIRCRMYACFAESRLFCLWQNGGVLKPVRFRTCDIVERSGESVWHGRADDGAGQRPRPLGE